MKFLAQAVCSKTNEDGSQTTRFALANTCSTDKLVMEITGFVMPAFFGKHLIEMKPVEPAEAGKPSDSTATMIRSECGELAAMLVEKNRAYGDSALDPVRVFSKADTMEQIRVRIDDKLSRLARGSAAGEDVEMDLLGDLILLRIARRKAAG